MRQFDPSACGIRHKFGELNRSVGDGSDLALISGKSVTQLGLPDLADLVAVKEGLPIFRHAYQLPFLPVVDEHRAPKCCRAQRTKSLFVDSLQMEPQPMPRITEGLILDVNY